MNHLIEHGPSYTLLTVHLSRGESLKAEAGAMVAMSSTVSLESGMSGVLPGTWFTP